MPTKIYYLDALQQEPISVKWGMFFRNTEVLYQGRSLGVVPSVEALRQGYAYTLPDGRSLTLRLRRSQGVQELETLLDGQPVPGSASHPAERLKQAWYTVLFVAGINVGLGLLGLAGVELMREMGIGWPNIIEGFVFLALGWWGYRKLSSVAFGVACGLLVFDGLFAIANGSSAGLVLRFFLCVLVFRGIAAARELRTKGQGQLSPDQL